MRRSDDDTSVHEEKKKTLPWDCELFLLIKKRLGIRYFEDGATRSCTVISLVLSKPLCMSWKIEWQWLPSASECYITVRSNMTGRYCAGGFLNPWLAWSSIPYLLILRISPCVGICFRAGIRRGLRVNIYVIRGSYYHKAKIGLQRNSPLRIFTSISSAHLLISIFCSVLFCIIALALY